MANLLVVFVPTGIPPLVELKPMAPRLGNLNGKRVALLNAMFDVTGAFLDQLQDWFRQNMPGVETFVVEIENSRGDGVPISERGNIQDKGHLERIKADADAAIVGLGLCASCTQAVSGTVMRLETEYGIPAVGVHNSAFKALNQAVVKNQGMPYLRLAYTPSPVVNVPAPRLREYIDGVDPVNKRPFMDVVLDALTVPVGQDEIDAAKAGLVAA
ncbi:MAG TPA: hypothetical protein VFS62_15005 [Chloroflexota bacterium]|jgi:hypothetical protein|nr:hypothetical protein [Chloroflexota bacterium]